MEAPAVDDRLASATVYLLAVASTHSLASPPCAVKRRAMASLRAIHRSLSSSSSSSSSSSLPDLVLKGFMAASPYLLSINLKSMVVKSIGILGDMALSSYESALQISHDEAVIGTLLNLLMVRDAGVVIEACHVIINLSACSLGKAALCDFGALHKLLLLISLIAETMSRSQADRLISLDAKWHGLPQNQEEMLFEILDTLNALTHNAFCECMRRIPKEEHMLLLTKFQSLWKRFVSQGHPVRSKVQVLCKVIVWLAMEQEVDVGSNDEAGEVLGCLFGGRKNNFKHFWDSHWERCPFLINNANSIELDLPDVFGNGQSSQKGDFFVKQFMSRGLACPLFSADELGLSSVYEEIEENLGKPLIFDQDVRLVKSIYTGIGIVQEVDYHKVTSAVDDTQYPLHFAEANMFVDAYSSGYTIALRGMEFRSPQVAKLAEELAVLFGQVTVGANLYLTPSGVQGFKPHLDDHCVFVWQIIGSKAWRIWPPRDELPRLYTQHVEVSNTYGEDPWSLMLKKGSVLYIPRGFPHAASTREQDQKPTNFLISPCFGCEGDITRNTKLEDSVTLTMQESESVSNSRGEVNITSQSVLTGLNVQTDDGYPQKRLKAYHQADVRKTNESLHITFGVEVERPFDWEGFVHMALHSWAENQNWSDILGKGEASATSTKILGELCTGLLHIAVRACGDRLFWFRKACLVAAKPFLSQDRNINTCKLMSFFQSLLAYVGQKADFKEAFDILLSAIDRKEGSSLDWMCWLRHLPGEGKRNVWSEPLTFFCEILMVCRSDRSLKDIEAGFINAKGKFVSSGSFSDAYSLFMALLCRYRNVRKRYINGMLALQT